MPPIKEYAALYISEGYQVVPLAAGTKACLEEGWNDLIFKSEDFKDDDNLGLRSREGIVDVDCDSSEVVMLAKEFLPPTGGVYGRSSKPNAHWLYKSNFDKIISLKDFAISDKKKATLVEIRVNHQSMAPPSIHPDDKEELTWNDGVLVPSRDSLLTIDKDALLHSVRLLATTALIGRHYNPEGNRHDWMLALTGFLRQLGLTYEEARKIVLHASEWARDIKVKDRLAELDSTYNHADDDLLKTTGGLRDLMKDGKTFIKSLNAIWGARSSAFIIDAKDKIIANSQDNVLKALEKLKINLFFDTFAQKPYIHYNGYVGPLEDPIRNRIWLTIDKEFRFRPAPEFFDVVLQDTAYQKKVHPVQDYLDSLKWDRKERLDTWLIRGAGASDSSYTRAVSAITLIAAVRRVRKPGCKFDEMLVLESEQGAFKSSVLRALCPDEDWFSDDLPLNVEAKQVIERTTGKWIIEAAELAGMKQSQVEQLKSLLSRTVDGPVRMAYARLPKSQPRQFIIIGTTNAHHYLSDPTGNRRFWPIRLEKFNIDFIYRERDQIWAEAAYRESLGESIRLPENLYRAAGIQQERRRTEDPWEVDLKEFFGTNEVVRVTPNDLWEHIGIAKINRDVYALKRISQIMQRLGFKRMAINRKGVVVKGWGRGDWEKGRKAPALPGEGKLKLEPEAEPESSEM